ncbi:MAG: translation initiation factor IF-2 [Clostridia bacterium]|nr:translation initiation factor IF-2 [Clostridia bacterium]
MAKKYEIVEKIAGLLNDDQLGGLQKRLASTEKSLSDVLKKLSVMETEKQEREAAEAVAKAEEAARIAAEEAAKAAAKAEEEAAKAAAKAEEKAKKAKKTASEKPAPVVEPVVEEIKTEEKVEEKKVETVEKVEEPVQPKKEEKPAKAEKTETEAKPEARTFVPKPETRSAAPAAPRAPRYFRNGQVQGEYVAKPGVESAPAAPSTYRPRPVGDRPARPTGDRPFNGNRPARPAGDRPTGDRPTGDRPARPTMSSAPMPAPIAAPSREKNFSAPAKKKTFEKTYTEKKPMSKRSLIKQQGMTVEDFDEDKSGYRKVRSHKKQKQQETTTIKIEHAVVTTKDIPLKVLSEKLGVTAVEITKRLFKEGIMKGINDSIDYEGALMIAMDLGIDLEYKPEKTAEEVLMDTVVTEDESKLVTRAPVVTVMGHVDHGKTSLLDKIRATSVTAGEAGGITQSIGAYTVTAAGKQITFIDTPGHAAFTAMRARGAQVTDIVILVVAADDGIMPQTVEAINHAKAANVPIIVAMNKMDKHEINPDRVKQELLEHELVPEEWGGDTMVIPVSAKTGMGIDELLESVNLVAEMQELKANPDRQAKGTIIEAKLDKGKGPVASIIVQTGTLKTGDNILSGTTMGRVRAMFDDKGRAVKSAGPSMAVSILGLEDVPNAGDSIMAVDQALMKQVQEERKNRERESMIKEQSRITLDDVFAQVEEGKIKNLNLIVKGDVQGSVEAVRHSLEKLTSEEVRVKVIHAAAGAINEGDVMLADSANAIIIGFNVRPDTKAKKLAEQSKVDVRSYRIIYELLDDMEAALKGMLAPKLREVLTGKCEVRQTFNITGAGTIAGCYVLDGKIVRGGKLRIYREDIMICEGGVKQLKRFKDDVKEVGYGYECGCAIEGFNEIRIGDIIECYVTEEIKA